MDVLWSKRCPPIVLPTSPVIREPGRLVLHLLQSRRGSEKLIETVELQLSPCGRVETGLRFHRSVDEDELWRAQRSGHVSVWREQQGREDLPGDLHQRPSRQDPQATGGRVDGDVQGVHVQN